MPPPPPHSPRRPLAGLIAVGLGLAGLLGSLVWIDVLPGAWTLRGWVQGAAARDAWVLRRARAARLAEFEAENSNAPKDAIIFLGSSTIGRFPLARAFPGSATLNRGLEGDTARALRGRLEASLPPGEPGGFVVQVGANDLRRDRLSPEQVGDDVAALLDELERRAPGAPVLLLGLFPVVDEGPAERERLERTNALLAQLAAERSAAFVPTDRAPLVNLNGTLVPELTTDPHHLASGGYELLTRWILAEGGEVALLLAP